MLMTEMNLDSMSQIDPLTQWAFRLFFFSIVFEPDMNIEHANRCKRFLTHATDKFTRVKMNTLMRTQRLVPRAHIGTKDTVQYFITVDSFMPRQIGITRKGRFAIGPLT